MEKEILNEFLTEAKAETGDTCLNTIIEGLHELMTAINTMPIGNFTMPTLLLIQKASQTLDGLNLIINAE